MKKRSYNFLNSLQNLGLSSFKGVNIIDTHQLIQAELYCAKYFLTLIIMALIQTHLEL